MLIRDPARWLYCAAADPFHRDGRRAVRAVPRSWRRCQAVARAGQPAGCAERFRTRRRFARPRFFAFFAIGADHDPVSVDVASECRGLRGRRKAVVAVIALIPDHFFETASPSVRHGLNVLGTRLSSVLQARGHIAEPSADPAPSGRHNRAGVEIDLANGSCFMAPRPVRAAILHLAVQSSRRGRADGSSRHSIPSSSASDRSRTPDRHASVLGLNPRGLGEFDQEGRDSSSPVSRRTMLRSAAFASS